MEFNFLVFRSPKGKPLLPHVVEKVRWVPCPAEEFVRPVHGSTKGLKSSAKIDLVSPSSRENPNVRDLVYPGLRLAAKETPEATRLGSLNDLTANDSPNKHSESKLPFTYLYMRSEGSDRKGSGIFHAETVDQLHQVYPSQAASGRPPRHGFSASFQTKPPSEPPQFLFESCKGIPIPKDLPGPNDLELSTDFSGNCNVYQEFGSNKAFNQAFEHVYAVPKKQNPLVDLMRHRMTSFHSNPTHHIPLQPKRKPSLGPESATRKTNGSVPRLDFTKCKSTQQPSSHPLGTPNSSNQQSYTLSKASSHSYQISHSTKQLISQSSKAMPPPLKSDRYSLGQVTYKVMDNGKDFLIAPPLTTVHKPTPVPPRPSFSDKFPVLLIEPFENRNPEHIVLYFHANAEDLGSSHNFLQHLSDSLSARLLAMEYPGYSVYDQTSPSEELVCRNADRLIGFVHHTLHYQLKNIILVGEVTRSLPRLFLRHFPGPELRLPQLPPHFPLLFPPESGRNHDGADGQQTHQRLLQKRPPHPRHPHPSPVYPRRRRQLRAPRQLQKTLRLAHQSPVTMPGRCSCWSRA